jgi:phospholipid/cholesterol/gamma-HCH transport system substrate-binding protein
MDSSGQQEKNLKVGITVFIGLVIFLVFVVVVGTEGNYFTKTYHLNMKVANVNGLTEGSMVMLGGIKIGYVRSMDFSTANDENVITVGMIIRSQYRNQITTGSVAMVKTIGMLGDKFVDISVGSWQEKPLNDGEYLTAKESMELGNITDKLSAAVVDFTGVMSNVKTMTDSLKAGKGSVGKLLRDESFSDELIHAARSLNAVTNTVASKKGTFGKLVYDDALYIQLMHTTENLSALTDSLRGGKGSLGKVFAQDSLYITVNSLARRMDALLEKLNSDTSSVGAFVNSPAAYKQVSLTLQNFNSLLEDIREHPDKYVHVTVF